MSKRKKHAKAVSGQRSAVGDGAVTATAPAAAPPGSAPRDAMPDAEGVVIVLIDHIVDPGGNHRTRADEEAIGRLGESLKLHGQLQPIAVVRVPGGGLMEIVYGRRRLEAAKRLGWTRIHAEVYAALQPAERRTLAAVENLEREGLSPIDEALAVAQLLEACGSPRPAVGEGFDASRVPPAAIDAAAARLGRSPKWVRDRAYLLRLCPKVREVVANGRLPLAQAREVAKLASAADQIRAAAFALNEWTDGGNLAQEGDPRARVIYVRSIAEVRRQVAERLSTLRGVPWKPDVEFAGCPRCDTCPDNSANTLLFGADDKDETPEARCLNTRCCETKTRAAEKAVADAVKKLAKQKDVASTAAAVEAHIPNFVKAAKVTRELERARGGGPKPKAGRDRPEEVPWEEQPKHQLEKADRQWREKVDQAVLAPICASPMRLACYLVGLASGAYARHVGWQNGEPIKGVRARIEPILKRIARGTEDDLKALADGFKPGDLNGRQFNSPLWVTRHLAGLLGVNLPPEPKLEDFLPKGKDGKAAPTPGVCRECGCTESDPCVTASGPCAWADAEETLCTACAAKAKKAVGGQPSAVSHGTNKAKKAAKAKKAGKKASA